MTFEELKILVDALGEDANMTTYEDHGTTIIEIIIKDFCGFDSDWNEVYRDYDKNAVKEFRKTLEKTCRFEEGCFYTHYYYGEFTVVLGYSSYEI